MANSEKRVSRRWKFNPKLNITAFNLDDITEDNFINHLIKLTQHDVTYSMIMNLFGSFNGKAFANTYDTFEVPKGAYSFINKDGKTVSNKTPFITTIGIWIFNIFLINGFGFDKFFGGYINKNLNAKDTSKLNQTLVYKLAEEQIDIDTYKRFLDYTQFLMPFETVLGYNHTEEVLKISQTIAKKKEELFKANQDAIDRGDINVAGKIEKELIEYAKDILKDDPGLDVYLSGAGGSIPNNFKNLYIMKGAIKNADPTSLKEYTILKSSFSEGITADEYCTLAAGLAAGPYARAKKPELGGYWEKLFSLSLQSITIDEPGSDCGTKKYITVKLTPDVIGDYMYNYIIKDNGDLEELTSDNMGYYTNKTVKMRFSIFCKSKTGICNKCAGNLFIRRNSKNIGLACEQIPSTTKAKSMKGFHDSTVKTTEINPMEAFGLE